MTPKHVPGAEETGGSGPLKPKRSSIRRRPGPQATRDAIMCAGRKLFIERGFGASMREIAVEAGMDHALLYRHFESKTDLFNQIFDQEIRGANEIRSSSPASLAQQRIDDLVLVAVRSASDPTARSLICDIIERRLIPVLAGILGGERAIERARLLLALAAGVEVVRDAPVRSDVHRDAMEPVMAWIVNEILTASASPAG